MVAHASVWIPDAGAPSFPSLSGDVVTDVVVVGAGISGLTTAALLQRAGHDVVVVDMHRVATGTTGHTTGKVTSQHGLIYARLAAEHGEETARMYGEANEAGVAMVAELAAEASADCDLTRAPAYVYTTDDTRVGGHRAGGDGRRPPRTSGRSRRSSRGPLRECPRRSALSRPVAP